MWTHAKMYQSNIKLTNYITFIMFVKVKSELVGRSASSIGPNLTYSKAFILYECLPFDSLCQTKLIFLSVKKNVDKSKT